MSSSGSGVLTSFLVLYAHDENIPSPINGGLDIEYVARVMKQFSRCPQAMLKCLNTCRVQILALTPGPPNGSEESQLSLHPHFNLKLLLPTFIMLQISNSWSNTIFLRMLLLVRILCSLLHRSPSQTVSSFA